MTYDDADDADEGGDAVSSPLAARQSSSLVGEEFRGVLLVGGAGAGRLLIAVRQAVRPRSGGWESRGGKKRTRHKTNKQTPTWEPRPIDPQDQLLYILSEYQLLAI